MMTHAQLAARLLRDAAAFFSHLAEENPTLQAHMLENAQIYSQVADLVEKSPTEAVALDEASA